MEILQEKSFYKTDLFVDLSRLSANLKNYRKGVHNKFYRKLIHKRYVTNFSGAIWLKEIFSNILVQAMPDMLV